MIIVPPTPWMNREAIRSQMLDEIPQKREPMVKTRYPHVNIFFNPIVSASFPNISVVLVRDRRYDNTTRDTVLMVMLKYWEIEGRETLTIYESRVAINAAKHTLYTMKRYSFLSVVIAI